MAKEYIIYCLGAYAWHVGTSMLGAYIADHYALGNLSFRLVSDVKKAAICSFLALAPPLAIFYFAPFRGVIVIYLVIYWFSCKFSYLDVHVTALMFLCGVNALGYLAYRDIYPLLPTWFYFLLVFAGVAALAVSYGKGRQKEREQEARNRRNADTVRRLAMQDEQFQTCCCGCALFNTRFEFCQRKIEGLQVREIMLKGRAFCSSWEERPGGNACATPNEMK